MAASTQYEKIATETAKEELDIEAIADTRETDKIPVDDSSRTSEEGEMISPTKFVTFRESGVPTLNLPEALMNAITLPEYCAEYQDMTSHGDKSELQIVKPLKVKVNVEKSPLQFQPVLSQIEELSDGCLWLFDQLAILPPTSQLKERLFPDKKLATGLNVFIAPNPNELRELATTADGSLKRLNDEQHREIRKKGAFSVPSKNFPGAVHSWKLTQLLQRGNEPANDDLKGAIAKGFYFTFIVARNRVTSRVVSIRDAVENIGYTLHFVYNSLIGGKIRHPNFNLEKEMFMSMTEDLKVADPNQLEDFATKFLGLCKSLEVDLLKTESPHNALYLNSQQKQELTNKAPNLYQSTNGDRINLFAISPSWIGEREKRIFSEVTDRIKAEYPPKRVQKLIKEYRDNGMTDKEIIKTIQRSFNREFLTNIISTLRENTIDNPRFPVKGEIETYLRGLAVIQEELKNENKRISAVVDETEKSLIENHDIKSKCRQWLSEKLEETKKVAEQNENTSQNLIDKLGEQEAIGPEWRYFIQRAQEFHISLPQTIDRLTKHNYTTVNTSFYRWIWKPTNYIVTEIKTGERKKDVQMVKECTHRRGEPKYFMKTKEEFTVTSEYPGWRWRKYFVSFYTWFINFLFAVLVGMVLKGPFSLSALFLWYKYPNKYELDYTTGNVYPYSFGNTFVTILRSLWKDIFKRRMAFEKKPDTGFLPKNMTRLFNRLQLYVIYGFFGTILFSLFFPILCVLLITLGIFLVITIPIWYVGISLIVILFRTLIYDFQYEDGTDRNPKGKVFPIFYLVIYKIGIRITLQFIAAIVIIVLMPILSIITIILASIRRTLRFMWDTFIYVVVIKPRGRVPITNSFVARRISGPGLATDYYYQIHPSQALIKFEYDLESLELQLYKNFMENLLDQPSRTYLKFLSNLFTPLGYHVSLQSSNKSIAKITSQQNSLSGILHKRMQERSESFRLEHPTVSVSKIRMVKSDLDTTIRIATQIIEEFYTKRILVYPDEDREELFSSKGLETNDWEGLAKIKLNESFSPSFLSPLEDSDESFYLHVEKLGLDDYFDALTSGLARHDLDRERMILVDKQYTYLPGINLVPKYDESWAQNNCVNLRRHASRSRVKKRLQSGVHLILTNDFNDKLSFAIKLAARVGWKNILGEDVFKAKDDVADADDDVQMP